MDHFGDLKALYGRMADYLESLSPISDRVGRALDENAKLAAAMLAPYDRFIKEMESVQRAIAVPESLFDTMRSALAQYQKFLAAGALDFQIASTWLDAVRAVELHVPEYLLVSGLDIDRVQQDALSFGRTYDQLRDSLTLPTTEMALATAAIVLPTLSTASHFQVLRSLGFTEAETPASLEGDFERAVERDWDNSRALVEKADPSWTVLLAGAEDSLRSNNPDKVRHAITSLRELLTQVIHRYAPEEEVRKELPEPKWYDKGKPTRRARLHLILSRRYGNDVLLDFVDKDVSVAMELFELFQKGTHEIVSMITPSELQFIVNRAKVVISELIIESDLY